MTSFIMTTSTVEYGIRSIYLNLDDFSIIHDKSGYIDT